MQQDVKERLNGLIKAQAEYIEALQEQQKRFEALNRATSAQYVEDIAQEQRRLGVLISVIAEDVLRNISSEAA